MKIDKMSDFISLMSAVFIIFGITYNILLYNNFAIDISEYVNLTESLLMFLPALPKFLYFLPCLLLAFDTLRPSSFNAENIKDGMIYSNLFDGKMFHKKFVLWICLITLPLIGISFIISEINNNQLFRLIGYLISLVFIVMFLPVILRVWYYASDQTKIPKAMPLLLCVGIFFGFNIFFSVETRTRRILGGYKNPCVKLIYKDGKSLSTDSLIRYIGKTEKFIFLYDKKSKTTTSIPLEGIKEYVYFNR